MWYMYELNLKDKLDVVSIGILSILNDLHTIRWINAKVTGQLLLTNNMFGLLSLQSGQSGQSGLVSDLASGHFRYLAKFFASNSVIVS